METAISATLRFNSRLAAFMLTVFDFPHPVHHIITKTINHSGDGSNLIDRTNGDTFGKVIFGGAKILKLNNKWMRTAYRRFFPQWKPAR
jgi:hypothetical protein